ncbi:TIGR01777 family oxidoreductase [Aliagarivorans taiwanensis]|uniref:TIGR01777 family oxidoreductase n=1 Tax=Aliagarivorans taiwanensis TaxID=561966 RepID=UPI000415F91A|nr:TIGR01777 family oxidoreductase [Aliagarivorans taiwanensis]
MKILLTGGTGFIGQSLARQLQPKHQLIILTRRPVRAYQQLGHNILAISSLDELQDLNDVDAVINLAGEPIANRRWTAKQKQRICDSRWQLTEELVEMINNSMPRPHTFISGSAIGVYGTEIDGEIDEATQVHEQCFTRTVCKRWEELALKAESEQTRVCLLRTGVVLGVEGGALAKMLPAFKLGAGGPMGSGQQMMSWIHIQDMVNGIIFLLNNSETSGVYNFTAPAPVSNQQFSEVLAKQLGRPCFFRTPKQVLDLAFGEMATLLLDGQQVLPKRLLEAGYKFRYPSLDKAMRQLV